MTSGCYVCLGKPKAGYGRVNVECEGKRREERSRAPNCFYAIRDYSNSNFTTNLRWPGFSSTLFCSFLPNFSTEIELEIELRWRSGASNCDCTPFELQLEIVPLAFSQCFNILLWFRCTQIIVESAYKGIARDNSIHNSKVLAFLQLISILLMISEPISVENRVEKLCVVDTYRMSNFLTTAELWS